MVLHLRSRGWHVFLVIAVLLFLRVAVDADLEYVSYDYNYVQTDFVPPVLNSTDPANAAEGVPIDAAIRMTFSKKVYLGEGRLILESTGETRYIDASDVQLTRDKQTNDTVILQLNQLLAEGSEYRVKLTPYFVVDFYSNQFLGDDFAFRTAGHAVDFVAFSPLVQAPESSVIFSLRTDEVCLYGGKGDEYTLQIWPSSGDVFSLPTASSLADGMDDRCARVSEVSDNFPSITACKAAEGRFRLVLGTALQLATEYSFVVRWPVVAGSSGAEVVWNIVAAREYNGVAIEVQRFRPWTHILGAYLYNDVDASRADLASFTMEPSEGQDVAAWRGPDTVVEFRVELGVGAVDVQPGARLAFVAAPLLAWSINPELPSNLTTMQSLANTDPTYLADSVRRALPCPHFFPGAFPPSTQCRLLSIGMGMHSYGFELRLPAGGMYARTIPAHETLEFYILLPGLKQPLGAIFFFEVVLENTVPAGGEAHSVRLPIASTPTLNTTAGMSLHVLSNLYPYAGPTYVQVNRVVVEFTTGVYLRGPGEVTMGIVEPVLARLERCVVFGDAPQPTRMEARTRGMPAMSVYWALDPLTAAPGPSNFVAYPHIRYRTECLLYNGPDALPYSRWRLTVGTADAEGSPLTFSRTFTSHTFVVAVPLAGAQVTPTLPLLARSQVIFVRFAVPQSDGGALAHWTLPTRRVRLEAPAGFAMATGPCRGFWPLTSSALPAAPLSRCVVASTGRSLEVTISPFEQGFTQGQTYAFRLVVGNPHDWERVESRMQNGVQIAGANWWTIAILEESTGVPLALLSDVPQSFAGVTASLRPDDMPNVHDTSFRIYRRPLYVWDIRADDPRTGHSTRVQVLFTLSTPLVMTDELQITAPASFAWVDPPAIDENVWAGKNLKAFPAREPEVFAAPWVIRVGVTGVAGASMLYGLALNITNPSAWTQLDRELNFWSLETFSGFKEPLDRRARRDCGVMQGYFLVGPLLRCSVAPSSRVAGDTSWVSLTFQLNEPVFNEDKFNPGPSRLRIKAPNGYSFVSAGDVGPASGQGNCVGLVDAKAAPDSPPLQPVQFPHTYSPFPSPSGFNCSVEADSWGTLRTLVLDAQEEGFGLLAHILYAFRVHVANPAYDRIWDVRWTLETVGQPSYDVPTGVVFESCSVPVQTPSVQRVEASLMATGLAAGPAGGLLAQQTSVKIEIASSVVAAAYPEPFYFSLTAPPGYVFSRNCADGLMLEGEDYELSSCSGRSAQAAVQLTPSQADAPLVIIATARSPPSSLGTRSSGGAIIGASALQWGFEALIGEGGQAPGLVGPNLRVLAPVTVQPTGLPYFSKGPTNQRALFAVELSEALRKGSVLEVVAPRHTSFTFDSLEGPCASMYEDPVVLGPRVVESSSLGNIDEGGGECNGISTSVCSWPAVRSCFLTRWGTRLEIVVAEDIQPLTTNCVELRIVGPSHGAPSLPASAAARHQRGAATAELAPALVGDQGRGEGVAPFVQSATHLSLCYESRSPSTEPAELVARMAPSSLGARKAGAGILGRLCVIGVPLAVDTNIPTCQILEPTLAPDAVERPTCTVLDGSDGCESQCVAISGAGVWASFTLVVAGLQVYMSTGSLPRLDLQLFDDSASLLQAATAVVELPVLNNLGTPTLTAPRAASTSAPFEVMLEIDWAYISSELEEATEEPAFLDVSTPHGLSISPTCQPVACRDIVPDDITPVPGIRLLLLEPALPSWQRRLHGALKASVSPGYTTRRDCSGSASERDSVFTSDICGTNVVRAWRRLFETSGLPSEIRFLVSAVQPFTQGDALGNVWSLVLRSAELRALAAEDLIGPGVAHQMEARVTSSSARAGDVFSRFIVEFRLLSPLPAGGILVVEPPSGDIPCDAELVEPADLLGLPADTPHVDPPEVSSWACILWVRQPLDEDITFAFSMPLTNPILTPEPNTWFFQSFILVDGAGGQAWRAHSAVEAEGFEIFGELELLRILPKSVFPQAVTPVSIHFRLRTPLPVLASSNMGPGQDETVVILRFAVSAIYSEAMISAFLASTCLLDVVRSDVLIEPVADAEVVQPHDCLVNADGTIVEFFFGQLFEAKRDYVVWTWIRNPPVEIANDPSWGYSISTVVAGGRVVHRMSIKLTPLLGVQASIDCGSYATRAKHRAVVRVTNGRMILGQRGAVEVTLPLGFRGSCEAENFRARPSLPTTARCRSHEASTDTPGRVVVYWRTLLGENRLLPPYEFSFGLENSNVSDSPDLSEYAWHVITYEGDNQEAVMDGTDDQGFRPFDLCPTIPFSLVREDDRIMSIVFQVGLMSLAGFDDLSLSGGFDNFVRVQVMSSLRAPIRVACPETSIWQARDSLEGHMAEAALGLPNYTVCVNDSGSESVPPSYEMSATQYRSAVFFMLPFATLLGPEPYGLEVVLDRFGDSQTGISMIEQAAELVALSIESSGVRRACASAALGPAPFGNEDNLLVTSTTDGSNGTDAALGGGSTVATG